MRERGFSTDTAEALLLAGARRREAAEVVSFIERPRLISLVEVSPVDEPTMSNVVSLRSQEPNHPAAA